MTAAVALGVCCAVSVVVAVRRARSHRPRRDPRRVLSSLATALARGVRAGMTPAESLSSVAPRFEGVVGEQLRSLAGRLSRGVSLDTALHQWVQQCAGAEIGPLARLRGAPRTPDALDVELLVNAVGFSERMGTGLAEAFEGVAASLLDRCELDDELRALTSQAGASVVVLCSLPVLGAFVVGALSPESLRAMFATPTGLVCMAVACGLDLAAVGTSRRLISVVLR